ncbi:MAG: SIR2 family protein [Acidobacteriales bacterium]|nr:SIR2 family protein [Terriglobales bacterium]
MKRSDWLRWVQSQPWYERDASAADNYSAVIENLLQPRENRREFFLQLINPSVPASPGYERLLDLLDHRRLETVLTTNFDCVLPDLHVMRRRPHHLEIIRTSADYTKFSTSPTHPQLIYLHGSVEHYTDQNLLNEVQRLDENLVSLLTPLLRDHSLIVVGYRGAEPSIMQHLLSDQRTRTNGFRRGIYWCVLPNSKVHPCVVALAHSLSGNLQLVEIPGFDEAMQALTETCATLPESVSDSSVRASSHDSQMPFDMEVTTGAQLDELDWSRVQLQVLAYCRRMQIDIPVNVTRAWLQHQMEQLDLLRRTDSGVQLTNASYLMFARNPARRITGAECHLYIDGEEKLVEGNLWTQLEALTELFTEVNRPFRLKGAVSESVYPYPPLALKELLVNTLVHRAYDVREPLRIGVDSKFIRLVNPGGLVDAVFQRVNTRLQEQIELGNRGIKGYRNPVIADLFYGGGAMDKEGSGLPDVHAEVSLNEGKVIFGPVDDTNQTFRALIYRREEEADPTTRTATPATSKSRFFANLLEVLEIPEHVWRARTQCANGYEVSKLAGSVLLPPFALKRSTELLTFTNLSDQVNPFRGSIDLASTEVLRTDEILATSEGRRNFVELLNRAFYQYLESRGLLVDTLKKRAYFGPGEQGPREITYQASFRQATRTVTKAVVSKRTNKVVYWQHEALGFAFESLHGEWALRILPGYVFTADGKYLPLRSSKVGVLATRKAARDFNMKVYNDLVFWTWVLAGGKDSFRIELGDSHSLSIRGLLLSCELAAPPSADLDVAPEMLRSEDAQLARLEHEVAEAAESELEGDGGEVKDAD